MAWEGSDRRSRLPADWSEIVAAVKDRAGGRCEAVKTSTGLRCSNPGTDCDHVVNGDDHALSNLQLLCRWHHRAKSSEEGHQAAADNRARAKRPKRPHPGLL